jgi:hypothetical protein
VGPTQRTVLVTRSLRLTQVSGFSCINPIAPFGRNGAHVTASFDLGDGEYPRRRYVEPMRSFGNQCAEGTGALDHARRARPGRSGSGTRAPSGAMTFAGAHRRYSGAINTRFHWTGHLFHGRFGAVVMDEPHLLAAARYIALNPVAAGLVSHSGDWPWSSTRAHVAGEDDDDELATVAAIACVGPRFCCTSHSTGRPATTSRIQRAPTIG